VPSRNEQGHRISGFLMRFCGGALPIVIVLLLLWAGAAESYSNTTRVAAYVLSGFALWFGWGSVRCNLATKWAGILLAAFLGLIVGMFAFGITIRLSLALLPILSLVSLVLFPVLLVGLPYVLYDLLFRAPYKGRFARARAERWHRRPQS
jgi:hypothetical protein